jgi:hypothetical protein
MSGQRVAIAGFCFRINGNDWILDLGKDGQGGEKDCKGKGYAHILILGELLHRKPVRKRMQGPQRLAIIL